MGQGGQIVILNATSKTLRRNNVFSSRLMDPWNFPTEIKPGELKQEYFGFDRPMYAPPGILEGECGYDMEGTNHSFIIRATDEPEQRVFVEHSDSMDIGKNFPLGWNHDGHIWYILYEDQGRFFNGIHGSDWMQWHIKTIGPRRIKDICMPGTHDSGMSCVDEAIPSSPARTILENLTVTQHVPISGQLSWGARYFDIRPRLVSDRFWAAHGTGTFSARGLTLDSIINDVNQFTSGHQELIILNISHACNANDNYRDLNQDEWNHLMGELCKINDLFSWPGANAFRRPAEKSLNYFIGEKPQSRAAVLCVIEAEKIDLGSYSRKGFYTQKELSVRNEYSDTEIFERLRSHQLSVMDDHYKKKDPRLNLLSWTLTPQNDASIVTKSVRNMATRANGFLLPDLYPLISPTSAYPNVLYVDFIWPSVFVALAMVINLRAYAPPLPGRQPLSTMEGKRVQGSGPQDHEIWHVLDHKLRYIPAWEIVHPLCGNGPYAWHREIHKLESSYLAGLPKGPPLSYENRLVREAPDKAVYLIDQGMKRNVGNGGSFEQHNFSWDRIQNIGEKVHDYPEGPLLFFDPSPFEGKCLKGSDDHPIYLVLDGKLRHISSPTVAARLFVPNYSVEVIPQDQVNTMPKGAAIDALNPLIQPPGGGFWLVDEGKQRHIPNFDTMRAFSFAEKEITTVGRSLEQGPPLMNFALFG